MKYPNGTYKVSIGFEKQSLFNFIFIFFYLYISIFPFHQKEKDATGQ